MPYIVNFKAHRIVRLSFHSDDTGGADPAQVGRACRRYPSEFIAAIRPAASHIASGESFILRRHDHEDR
jgi:hypothetical protein